MQREESTESADTANVVEASEEVEERAEPTVVEETVGEEAKAPTEKGGGLSLRDALEVALEAQKEGKVDDKSGRAGEASDKEGKAKAGTGANNLRDGAAKGEARGGPSGTAEGPLTPPAEYSPEEKADFLALSRKGQEAQLRLDRSRRKLLDEAKREREALKIEKTKHDDLVELSRVVSPFVKAMGLREPTEVALKKALTMWDEFENKDPRSAVAAYLKVKGIEVPDGFLQGTDAASNKVVDEKITPLQKEVEALKMRQAEQDLAVARDFFSTSWNKFEQEKNAAGERRFPDVAGNSETALRLASQIGSLVSGGTELSNQFIRQTRERIPNITPEGLFAEAYKFLGGKEAVADSSSPRFQDTQKHIQKAKRAASSVPGRGGQGTVSGPVKKYKTYREAAEAALAEIQEREGA